MCFSSSPSAARVSAAQHHRMISYRPNTQDCICQISAGGSESWVSVATMTQCCIETISNRQEGSLEKLKLTPLAVFIHYAGGQPFLVGGQTPNPPADTALLTQHDLLSESFQDLFTMQHDNFCTISFRWVF